MSCFGRSTQRSPRPAQPWTRLPRSRVMVDVTTVSRRITARRAPSRERRGGGSCAAHTRAQAATDLPQRRGDLPLPGPQRRRRVPRAGIDRRPCTWRQPVALACLSSPTPWKALIGIGWVSGYRRATTGAGPYPPLPPSAATLVATRSHFGPRARPPARTGPPWYEEFAGSSRTEGFSAGLPRRLDSLHPFGDDGSARCASRAPRRSAPLQ